MSVDRIRRVCWRTGDVGAADEKAGKWEMGDGRWEMSDRGFRYRGQGIRGAGMEEVWAMWDGKRCDEDEDWRHVRSWLGQATLSVLVYSRVVDV